MKMLILNVNWITGRREHYYLENKYNEGDSIKWLREKYCLGAKCLQV